MMEGERVCCMCGDVGFPDKIFRCSKCHNRFQHSYCSNYYTNESTKPVEVCEWCLTNEISQTSKHQLRGHDPSKKTTNSSKLDAGISKYNRSEYSGDKIKQHDVAGRDEGNSSEKGKSPTGAPSPRTRRYKLLKDVMC